ncbi:1-deoxy-D-xylulose-5-phosphate synthase [uncultured Clostridium sp.]|uniref:1-deoxy-D-xylulose-5-phosphate synthase n=1 Tax=uncultured Clostridium sp. TaxID=59620 RepID=UPI00263165DC|nr:1-deoxy-D-xylulose-5-phosphate synthase [uncultured Clostridium sp.]
MNILNKINSPKDVRDLDNKELYLVGNEIREFLISSVSKTGGHLASNLGVVELTLSIFREFDLDKDKVIWDVGHQSYVHKILTGRKDDFDVLRTHKGMSGFPKRKESKYDAFDTGHSSTSISAALGMARARDLKGEDSNIVAVIGDGALTGGMALEALNDVGYNKTNLIIILNDNQMSISTNVGGLSSYLNRMRMQPKYNMIKKEVKTKLSESEIGENLALKLTRVKDSIKQLVVPSMLFEDMGVKYLGPIDGHDIVKLREVISNAKMMTGPVIIHTITKKGKGYELAEESPCKYHGISPFNKISGEVISKSSSANYSKKFGEAMKLLANEDKDIVAITAAMPDGTGLTEFAKEFKNRFFDVGIAEQHAVTMAAGMACAGLKPVFAVYSTFLQRGLDQVLHDVCIQNLPVVFAIDRAGIVGEDGETHQGIFDVSYLSIIPNMTIIAPKCLDEVYPMLKWAINKGTPVAIRYPRGGDILENMKPLKEIKYGEWEQLDCEKSVISIIATGKMVSYAMMAKEKLIEKNIKVNIINAAFIKPIDEKLLKEVAENSHIILTVEDNVIAGGLGSNVNMKLNEYNFKGKFEALGYKDKFIEQGKVDILYNEEGLDSDGIKNKVLELIQEGDTYVR